MAEATRELYILRSKENAVVPNWYHWAFRLGPDTGSGQTIHAYYDVQGSSLGNDWALRSNNTPIHPRDGVLDQYKVDKLLGSRITRSIAIMTSHEPDPKHPNWNCQNWIDECIKRMKEDGIIGRRAFSHYEEWHARIIATYDT